MGKNLACMDDVGAIDQAKRLAHIVVGNQDANASLREVTHKLLNIGDRNRIDAGERLIEQHVTGPACQGPGNLQPPPLAARERYGRRLPQMRDVELLQQRVEVAFTLLAASLDHFQHGADVVLYCQIPRKIDASWGR